MLHRLLTAVSSLVAEHGLPAHRLGSCDLWALEHRLNSCGSQAQLLRGMWDLPGSGIELVSLALAGGFFTTEPPGKPAKVMGGNLKAKAVIFHLWMIFPGGCEGSTWERTPSPANTRSCHWETGVQKGPRGTLSAARAKRLLGYLDIYPRSYHHAQGRNHFPGPLGCINA